MNKISRYFNPLHASTVLVLEMVICLGLFHVKAQRQGPLG
jgi:hypothetical protein